MLLKNLCINYFPLATKVPARVRILLFSFFKMISFIILLKLLFSVGSLFINELELAVSQFYPSTSGGRWIMSTTFWELGTLNFVCNWRQPQRFALLVGGVWNFSPANSRVSGDDHNPRLSSGTVPLWGLRLSSGTVALWRAATILTSQELEFLGGKTDTADLWS